MKILYGVQGTGNGHITRARVMNEELRKAGHDVQFLFSGRPQEKYFNMGDFGIPIYKKGLTFAIENGKVNHWKTFHDNDQSRFLRDIDHLHLADYDVIISDYEPITSWAARLQKRTSIGVGHQYAFDYDIPKSHNNFFLDSVMRWFAPVSHGIGLHWGHFDQPILPPIIELPQGEGAHNSKTILVYLPFESPQFIIDLLSPYTNYDFIVYGHSGITAETPNVIFYNPSREIFQRRLRECGGVICNAGFELIAEALSLGKKILAKPVHGQMEQHSNAKALDLLGYGMTSNTLHPWDVERFLNATKATKIVYPNVAAFIVRALTPHGLAMPHHSVIWKDVQISKVSI